MYLKRTKGNMKNVEKLIQENEHLKSENYILVRQIELLHKMLNSTSEHNPNEQDWSLRDVYE